MEFPYFAHYKQKRLHLGICGSIAAYKMLDLMRHFAKTGINIQVTLTPSAQKFVTPLSFQSLGADMVYTAMFEGEEPFAHLLPGQIADALLIAPASASTISRLAHGAADEMLACQTLAFDGPIALAPAMNTKMWLNPATSDNVGTLVERGYFLIEPESGKLACDESGAGRLADTRQIYLQTLKLLTEQDLFGKKVLVTLGPTQEKWDAVRVWTNNSSGSMGTALATAAWLRGAEVYVVAGPVKQNMPNDDLFHRYNVENAREMFEKCQELWDKMDIGIFTAAVADFFPCAGIVEDRNEIEDIQKDFSQGKFKKGQYGQGFSIEFKANTDILRTLGLRKQIHQKVMGFAAEAGSGQNYHLLSEAIQHKLLTKNCDMLVGNFVQEAMGSQDNRVLITDTTGKEELLPSMTKNNLAWHLLSHLHDL